VDPAAVGPQGSLVSPDGGDGATGDDTFNPRTSGCTCDVAKGARASASFAVVALAGLAVLSLRRRRRR
jgi:MYXO-CTERM domain-containing protein